MVEALYTVVLDTSVLARGIIHRAEANLAVISSVQHGQTAFYKTRAVEAEYQNVFKKPETEDKTPITAGHRRQLQELLSFGILLHDRHHPKDKKFTAGLIALDGLNPDERDRKFTVAAAAVAAYSHGLCHLVSDDYHLAANPYLVEGLKELDVLVFTAHRFALEKGLVSPG